MKRLYVGNLPFQASIDDIRNHFASIGPCRVTVPTDKATGRMRGFGFVEYSNDQDAEEALALDGGEFQGRALRVNEAHERAQTSRR